VATADTALPRARAGRAGSSGFRPDIEGLRALAVGLVLLYHVGLPVRAGFVGVDVFFVISGFLITGLLLAELERTGRISWVRFVGRRIRRLLPAAVLVLAVVSAWSFVVVPGLRRREIGYDVMAAATYVVNWVLARREVDYLASDAGPSPVQHYWSLAVEEQFYVLWPLLLIVLALLVRRPSRRVVGGALGALVTASFAWSLYASHVLPRQSFFTTTTRIWELGVGALLAVWLAGRERPVRPARGSAAAGWAGLAVVVAVALLLPTDIEWPSAWALLPTLPTALVIWSGWQGDPGGPVRLLGARPLVVVGALSYSIYLWHWPAIVLGEWTVSGATGERAPTWVPVVLGVAAVVPAWLSWRFVESPIHHGPWLRDRPRALLAAGPALSAVGVLAALALLPLRSPFHTTPPDGRMPPLGDLGAATVVLGRPADGTDDPAWVTPDPLVAGEDRPAADVDRCQVPAAATSPVRCTFGEPGGPVTVALVGDSKAMQWLPALQEAAHRRSWRIVTYGKSSCAFADARAATAGTAYPECDAWNAAVMEALGADRPDLVVTSGVAHEAWDGAGTAREPLVAGYASRWRSLAADGIPVLVVGDSPVSPDDLDVCAARHPHHLDACTFPEAEAVAASGLPVQREALTSAGPGVALLDLTPWICPGGQCPVVVGNVAVNRPGDHVTATYAATLAPQVGQAVDRALGR
jgi:peptidoglycan/LPS O-acetylase OafA/YrhL